MDENKIPNLRERMAAAMADIGRVAKSGKNEAQRYNYTKADDIITEVREALIKHGIVFVSSEVSHERLTDRESKSGGAILSTIVTMEFRLLDSTSEEFIVAHHSGEGMDSGDKATNKAKTAALKYFLQQTFLIPTGDDPEKDDHEVKTVRQPRQQRRDTGGPTAGGVVQNALPSLVAKARTVLGKEEGDKWLKAETTKLGVNSATISLKQCLDLLEALNQFSTSTERVDNGNGDAPASDEPPLEDSDIEY